jgi:site-specific recombinase XerD
MANVRFNLDRGYIFLIYDLSTNDRLKFSIKEKIDKKFWDSKNQKVKANWQNSHNINVLLNTIKNKVDIIRLEYKTKGERLTSTLLRHELTKVIYGNDEALFSIYYKKWITEKNLKPGTKKSYVNSCKKVDTLFPQLKFSDVNKKWLNTFYEKMTTHKLNYTSTVLKKFKECMSAAHIDGVHQNLFYKTIVCKTEEVENIYLNLNDISKIYDHISKFDNRLKNAAIIFLVGCLSGQRHQTYSKINKTMIVERNTIKMITMMTDKTTTRVSIPLSDKLEALLNMHTTPLSLQKLNKYIKEVCEIVGIENYNAVSSHTARRSFATNAVIQGLDISMIMKITGHKTEKEFRKYIKMDDILAATHLSKELNIMYK